MISFSMISLNVSAQGKYPYQDPTLDIDARVADLISRLTLEEKAQLMRFKSPAIERLGIPAFNWWNEGLHGVARTSEKTTVFPQAIGMAASFDTETLKDVGNCVSTEGRAIFNQDFKDHKTGEIYRGLTYWSPNINIFRDPRWGRGQETYGEDPYLTGKLAVAFVGGIQGNDPTYYKAAACLKHFAVHSGPESERHIFDARPSEYDLWDTYISAFRLAIKESDVAGVMCAYNRIDGVPCCGNDKLLVDILRNQLGFTGYQVSDCWAVPNFYKTHKTHPDAVSAASDAVISGTDMECGDSYTSLVNAVERGMLSEKNLNVSLARDLKVFFKLGFFDPQDIVPYSKIGKEVIECQQHKELADKMARESMVLLKNKNNYLPLDASKIKRIAIIGPNADNDTVQLGNYNGFPTEIITPYKSLKKRFGDKVVIDYIKGCDWTSKIKDTPSYAEIAAKAKKADVIIFVGGISPTLEGELGDAGASAEGFFSGDRTILEVPKVQTELLSELGKTNRPIIVVNMSGSAVTQTWAEKNAAAIIQAWYPGQAGNAVTDVIFGDYNPSGKLPITIYRSENDLPAFTDYSMRNRTYRYFAGDVQYPFGYGLSYTTFGYQADEKVECETGKELSIKGSITNTGSRDGDEVLQLYVIHNKSIQQIIPICALKGFQRINLKKGETKEFEFKLKPEDLALTDNRGNLIEKAEDITLFIGGGQPGKCDGVYVKATVKGETYNLN